MSPSFRHALPEDAPAVLALTEKAYRGEAAAKGWTNEAAYLSGPRTERAEIDRLIAGPDTRFILAMEGADLVGAALVQQSGEGAYFGMFSIDPDRQSQGLGKALLAQCEAAVVELWQARYLRLSVISLRGELIGWYERRGFVLTGDRQPFPFSDTTGEVRRDFDLVEMRKPLAAIP